jgi:hypothetical protein
MSLDEGKKVAPKTKKNIAERTYGLIKLDAKSIDEIIEDTKYGSQSECDDLIIEEEKNEDQSLNDRRKKILDKYYGIVKLDRVVSLEEILELGDDSLRY